jgi:hypothetical protein
MFGQVSVARRQGSDRAMHSVLEAEALHGRQLEGRVAGLSRGERGAQLSDLGEDQGQGLLESAEHLGLPLAEGAVLVGGIQPGSHLLSQPGGRRREDGLESGQRGGLGVRVEEGIELNGQVPFQPV